MIDHEDAIEEEVNGGFESGDRRELEKLYDQSLKQFKEGSIVSGKVVQIGSGVVVMDLGYKSDGIIPCEQFSADELETMKPGDEVDVYLQTAEDAKGNLVLSREKAKKMQARESLNHAYESGTPVTGRVTAKVKGGLAVDIGVKAFLPGSQIDVRPVSNLDQFIGQNMELKIIKMNPGRDNIVVSRRTLLEDRTNARKEETLAKLAEGQTVEGFVKNLTDYGAFIDLGGIDGLLHITDMSWGRINHPSEVLSVGDTCELLVLKYDKEKQKVSLGLKQKTEDPWLSVAERFPVDSRVRGKVVSLTDYGAFVELEHGVEGLVHVSEMSWTQKIKHPSQVVSVGDVIQAQVLTVNPAGKRISLGIKQVEPNPWQTIAERYPVGSEIEGKIKTITDFGAFVGLQEGIDGLIHISDLSWTRHIRQPSDVLKKGELVKAVVLNIDPEKERISLGIKQLTTNPWEKVIPERYTLGTEEQVTVVKKTDFGLFVALEHDVEGLIPASEIPKGISEINEGEKITAQVIKVDGTEQKIALSIKAHKKGQSKSKLEEYMNQQPKPDTSIGALLKERS